MCTNIDKIHFSHQIIKKELNYVYIIYSIQSDRNWNNIYQYGNS